MDVWLDKLGDPLISYVTLLLLGTGEGAGFFGKLEELGWFQACIPHSCLSLNLELVHQVSSCLIDFLKTEMLPSMSHSRS
jgi:hypothetical protein